MRNVFFRFTGFNGAILALLLLLVSPFEFHAQPSTPDVSFAKEEVRVCPLREDAAQGDSESLKEFWQQAWGRDLVVGEEGMILQEGNAADQWDILVGNKANGRWIDGGAFVEEVRHAIDLEAKILDRMYQAAAKATYLQRYVVAGTVIGSTGNSISVTAIVTELGDESRNITRSFSVSKFGTDSSEMRIFSENLAKQLDLGGVESLDPGSVGFEKSGPSHCENQCADARDGEIRYCNALSTACTVGVVAAAGFCLAVCPASGPLYIGCVAACDALFIAGLSGCAAALNSCRMGAWDGYATCTDNCAPCALCELQ